MVDHLARNPDDRVLIDQIPNVWIIRRQADEDGVITDIQQTDFFDLLRDTSDAEQYNFLIVTMTNMVVQVFPILDCDIHDNVVGNCQYLGRGGADDSDGEEEDEESVEYDDDEECSTSRNPYILDEVSEDENGIDDDEGDDDDDDDSSTGGGEGGGRTKDERLNKYVKAQSCNRKNCPLISLKMLWYKNMEDELELSRYTRNCVSLHKLHVGDCCPSLLVVRRLMPQKFGRRRWNTILHTNIISTSNQMICLRVCT